MRHQRKGKKLGRSSKQRKALFRGLATVFFEHGYLQTTVAKAKALRPLVEKMITLAAGGSLVSRRKLFSLLTKKAVGEKLVGEIGPRFRTRKGGYTRMVRLGRRRGDGAETARLELVEDSGGTKKKAKTKKVETGRRGSAKKEEKKRAKK